MEGIVGNNRNGKEERRLDERGKRRRKDWKGREGSEGREEGWMGARKMIGRMKMG